MKTERNKTRNVSKEYLIGSGISGLASAVYLEKDAGFPGETTDGASDKDNGFVVRGGRMHEMHYEYYQDLLSHIPYLEDPNVSVRDESYDFNERFFSNGQARLLKDGKNWMSLLIVYTKNDSVTKSA